MLLKLLVVIIEVTELVGEDVSVRTEVEGILAKSLLQSHNIEAQTVLSCDFITLREMIDLLVLVKSLVLVTLARAGAPQDVPLMGVGGREPMLLQDRPTKFIVEPDHLVEQLGVLNVVALLVAVVRERARDHLLVRDVLEVQEFTLILILLIVKALPRVGSLTEEASLAANRGPIRRARG